MRVNLALALARGTRNGPVVRLMELLLPWVEPLRYKTMYTRSDLALSLDLVAQMMEAVETADPAKVAATTETRLSILERALEEQTGRRLPRQRRPANDPHP